MSELLLCQPFSALVLSPVFGAKQAEAVFIRKGFEDIHSIELLAFATKNRIIKNFFLNGSIDFWKKKAEIKTAQENGARANHKGAGKVISAAFREVMWSPVEAEAAAIVAEHVSACNRWLEAYKEGKPLSSLLVHIIAGHDYYEPIRTHVGVPDPMRRALEESKKLYDLVKARDQALRGVLPRVDGRLGEQPFRC